MADTEDELNTDPFTKRFTQIAALDSAGVPFHNRGDSEEFLRYLHDKAAGLKRLIVYFHNCQYDLGGFFQDALDSLNLFMVGGRLIRAQWGPKIEFRDTFNLWPMGLAQIGNAFGLEKGKMDVHSKDYVMRDVEIMHAAITHSQKLCREFDCGLPCTLGGLAVRAWNALGGSNHMDVADVIKPSMFGGRTELFAHGGAGNILYCDINSLYPSCMIGDFPGECTFHKTPPMFGMAEVTIQIPKMCVAPLPYRDENGAVSFPCGVVRGSWILPEIRNAEALGAKVLKWHTIYGTNQGYEPYSAYVEHFYDARLRAKTGAEKLQYKLLLNNLYGKLGASGKVGRSLDLTEDTVKKYTGQAYGQKMLCQVEMPPAEHVNWLHAAYVTGRGRLALQRYLRMIPADRLIYCDTDSIFFFWPDGNPPFPISAKLGAMKLEDTISEMFVVCPKVYRTSKETKAKGVPKKFQKEFYDDGYAEYLQPYKIRESIRYYDRKNSRPLSIWRTVHKTMKTRYTKKRFDKKSGRYYPLIHKGK